MTSWSTRYETRQFRKCATVTSGTDEFSKSQQADGPPTGRTRGQGDPAGDPPPDRRARNQRAAHRRGGRPRTRGQGHDLPPLPLEGRAGGGGRHVAGQRHLDPRHGLDRQRPARADAERGARVPRVRGGGRHARPRGRDGPRPGACPRGARGVPRAASQGAGRRAGTRRGARRPAAGPRPRAGAGRSRRPALLPAADHGRPNRQRACRRCGRPDSARLRTGGREKEIQVKIHAIQTGTVAIKSRQREGKGHGTHRLLNTLVDREWTPPLPIYAYAIEHPEGVIVVDTGETARVTEPGYFPRWHPVFRFAVREEVPPEQEIGPQLEGLGIPPSDIRRVVMTHLHTDHAGGLYHFPNTDILVARAEL